MAPERYRKPFLAVSVIMTVSRIFKAGSTPDAVIHPHTRVLP